MGYYPETVNFFGFRLADNDNIGSILHAAEGTPFAIMNVGAFDGADSRIHNFVWVFCFKKYSEGYDEAGEEGIAGDIRGAPTDDEVASLRKFCEQVGTPWQEPIRERISFIR